MTLPPLLNWLREQDICRDWSGTQSDASLKRELSLSLSAPISCPFPSLFARRNCSRQTVFILPAAGFVFCSRKTNVSEARDQHAAHWGCPLSSCLSPLFSLLPSAHALASNANVYGTARRDEASSKWPSKLQGGVGTRVECAYIMTPPKKCELLLPAPTSTFFLPAPSSFVEHGKALRKGCKRKQFPASGHLLFARHFRCPTRSRHATLRCPSPLSCLSVNNSPVVLLTKEISIWTSATNIKLNALRDFGWI